MPTLGGHFPNLFLENDTKLNNHEEDETGVLVVSLSFCCNFLLAARIISSLRFWRSRCRSLLLCDHALSTDGDVSDESLSFSDAIFDARL